MNEAEASPLHIAAHGKGWLVVEKPAGLSVHNDPDRDLISLMARFPGFGLHAVHRLDRDTSGLILLACRRDVFHALNHQFTQGKVDKEYLALVHGRLEQPPDRQWANWDFSLAKTSGGRTNIPGNGKRLPCLTRYRVEGSTNRYTLLRCRLVTGRKHQIRRHAALAGHPVLGDRRYGSSRACRYLARHHHFTRLALHAALLRFQPPEAAAYSVLQSSRLP
ncbi:MAG: RNA pseudouridine synthase, partial [Desulfosarcinaceae bacterium]